MGLLTTGIRRMIQVVGFGMHWLLYCTVVTWQSAEVNPRSTHALTVAVAVL